MGKLTERNNRTQPKLISEPKELYRFQTTPGIEVINLVFDNDRFVWVSWKFTAEEPVPILRHTNEFIVAYVTAGARIHLYQHLVRLQDKAIDYDTDTVIFIQLRDEPLLVDTWDKLGDKISELKHHEIISEFVSGGSKKYSYTIIDIRNNVNQMKNYES